LEIALQASERIAFIPAHIWTPWFSILGSKSGFDSVSECFEDLTPHLTAMETGLSTDAPMHWACTFLDPFTLISNSDAHSPEKLGRNANLFDTDLSYTAMIDALKKGDPQSFLGTIDLFPQEGKYHYDGHRKCRICWDPLETLRHKSVCPQCGKKVTVGVMHRVAQLADRDNLEERPHRLPFVSIIPLKEMLSEMLGTGPGSKKVDAEYHALLHSFGPELHILLDMSAADMANAGKPLLAEALQRMRTRRVIIQEGYDGEFGVIRVFQDGEAQTIREQQALFSIEKPDSTISQRRLINFDLKEYRRLYADQRESEPTQLRFETQEKKEKLQPALDGLNPEQRQAAQHYKGPALVLAGPGTGKTRVLTHRIAYLIQEKGIDPGNILAVTFTNKAAQEINQRLDRMLPRECQEKGPLVATFHAFGYSVLKEYATHLGRNRHFTLVDETEKLGILQHKLKSPRMQAKNIAEAIRLAKQSLFPLERNPVGAAEVFWKSYEETCRAYDLFDLDDCIYRPALLFKEHPGVCKEYQRRFPWILIDEYQDINLAQYRMVRLLKPGSESGLYAIGDPDQAIYGFRGADVRYIQEFQQDYSAAAVYRLNKSYRCSDTILKASGRVIARAGGKTGLLQGLQEGVKIVIAPHVSDRSEAEFVARTIENMIGGLGFFSMDSDISSGESHTEIKSLSDFAVLCRTKHQIRPLEKAFRDHSIPWQTVGETAFFQQEPAREVIDMFKLAANPHHVLLKDKFSRTHLSEPGAMETLVYLAHGKSVHQAIANIIEAFFLKQQEAAPNDFARLLDLAPEFGSDKDAFFEFTTLGSGPDAYLRNLEAVALMTLHAAKGLEFRCVFIVGCEDGLLPYSLMERKSDREEERRLLYVGMTRAEKYLLLSHADKRFLLGREFRLTRSPFIDHIEEELLQKLDKPEPPRKKDSQMKLF
jgi:DNA helicase-2/ATP-dependent DNA helicase PcrA